MSEDNMGRRLADKITRYLEAVLLALMSALLSIIIYFYGGIPKQINELVNMMGAMQLEMRYMQTEVRELKETQRLSQTWRERQTDLEKQIDKAEAQLKDHEKRIDKLETPFWIDRQQQRR